MCGFLDQYCYRCWAGRFSRCLIFIWQEAGGGEVAGPSTAAATASYRGEGDLSPVDLARRILGVGDEGMDFVSARESALPDSSPSPPKPQRRARKRSNVSPLSSEVDSPVCSNRGCGSMRMPSGGERRTNFIEISDDEVGSYRSVSRSEPLRLRRPPKIRRVLQRGGSPKLSLSSSPNHKEDDGKTLKDSLFTMSTGEVIVRAMLWLDDMEAIRSKSRNLQYGLSGKLKRRIEVMQSVVNILSNRAEEEGATNFLQAKNKELEVQAKSQFKEISLLNEKLSKADAKIKSLEREVRFFKERIGSSRSVSMEPMESGSRDRQDQDDPCTLRGSGDLPRDATNIESISKMVVNATKSEFKSVFQEYEDRMIGMMEELVKMRTGLVGMRDGSIPPLVEEGINSGGE